MVSRGADLTEVDFGVQCECSFSWLIFKNHDVYDKVVDGTHVVNFLLIYLYVPK